MFFGELLEGPRQSIGKKRGKGRCVQEKSIIKKGGAEPLKKNPREGKGGMSEPRGRFKCASPLHLGVEGPKALQGARKVRKKKAST